MNDLRALQQRLRQAGASISRDAIARWTRKQREEAQKWATAQVAAAASDQPGRYTSVHWPDHVSSANRIDRMPRRPLPDGLAPEHEPQFYLQVNEAQCTELSFGRVPEEVKDMARTMVDWTQEDLRRNAAKPVRHGGPKRDRRRVHARSA